MNTESGSSGASLSIIDLGPFLDGAECDKRAVAEQIYKAATETGFTYLENFGIAPALITRAFEMSGAFFRSEDKFNIPFDPEINHGYAAVRNEALDPTKPPDLKESFTTRNALRLPTGASHWPEPAFESLAREFYAACRDTAQTIMQAFSMALDLPASFFDDNHTGLSQTLRFLNYPPTERPEAGQLGAGAHTDYGTITLLFQDNKRGLQVQNVHGVWLDAAPIEDTVVINTGDLIARWSNDVFKSTPHRVVPRPQSAAQGRQSIAFFSDPDPDVLIEAFPSCIDNDRPAKYPPITAGEHIQKRILASQRR